MCVPDGQYLRDPPGEHVDHTAVSKLTPLTATIEAADTNRNEKESHQLTPGGGEEFGSEAI